jgi:hypothetical protein
MNDKTEVIPRTTLADMVIQWKVAQTEVTDAYRLLLQAEARLKSSFKPDSYLFDLSRECFRSSRYDKPDLLIKELKKDGKVERFLIEHSEQIAKYLNLRAARLKDEAQKMEVKP